MDLVDVATSLVSFSVSLEMIVPKTMIIQGKILFTT